MARRFCGSNLQYGPYFPEMPTYRFFYQFVRNMQGIHTFANSFLCALGQGDGGFLSLKILNIHSIGMQLS
jgi:hypothetical protein